MDAVALCIRNIYEGVFNIYHSFNLVLSMSMTRGKKIKSLFIVHKSV